MSAVDFARRASDPLASLFRVELPERDVCVGTMMAAGFNLFGMPVEFLILRKVPVMPLWPPLVSMAVGAAILGSFAAGLLRGKPGLVRWLFVLNGTAVAVALFFVDPYFAALPGPWVPFQASKLGALVAAMLAPGFVPGLVTIAITVGLPMVQIPWLPEVLRVQAENVAPWALFAFGLGGVFVLVHRMRVRHLELRALQALADAATTRRLAQAFLELRDLMNTPLQAIEFATGLLRERQSQDDAAVLEALRRSCDRLGAISEQLKKFEHEVDWKRERGGLGESPSELTSR